MSKLKNKFDFNFLNNKNINFIMNYIINNS